MNKIWLVSKLNDTYSCGERASVRGAYIDSMLNNPNGNIESWVVEAPTRHQALKIAKKDYNSKIIERKY